MFPSFIHDLVICVLSYFPGQYNEEIVNFVDLFKELGFSVFFLFLSNLYYLFFFWVLFGLLFSSF